MLIVSIYTKFQVRTSNVTFVTLKELTPYSRGLPENLSSSVRQEIPCILLNKKAHFLVNINPPLIPVLKHINLFHALNSIS
jgi:hypothetical protein